MAVTVTDYHSLVAAEAKAVLDGLGFDPSVAVAQIEDMADVGTVTTLPAVVVCPVGPEQERPEFGTNLQTGLAWPVVVMLLTQGQTGGAKSPNVPSMTEFRRLMYATFDKKRALSGSSNPYVANCVCEVSPTPVLFDKDEPAFSRLQTYLTVLAVGRFPRSAS